MALKMLRGNALRALVELFKIVERNAFFFFFFFFFKTKIEKLLKDRETVFISENYCRLDIRFISFSVTDVKTKIHSLRTHYTRELRELRCYRGPRSNSAICLN